MENISINEIQVGLVVSIMLLALLLFLYSVIADAIKKSKKKENESEVYECSHCGAPRGEEECLICGHYEN